MKSSSTNGSQQGGAAAFPKSYHPHHSTSASKGADAPSFFGKPEAPPGSAGHRARPAADLPDYTLLIRAGLADRFIRETGWAAPSALTPEERRELAEAKVEARQVKKEIKRDRKARKAIEEELKTIDRWLDYADRKQVPTGPAKAIPVNDGQSSAPALAPRSTPPQIFKTDRRFDKAGNVAMVTFYSAASILNGARFVALDTQNFYQAILVCATIPLAGVMLDRIHAAGDEAKQLWLNRMLERVAYFGIAGFTAGLVFGYVDDAPSFIRSLPWKCLTLASQIALEVCLVRSCSDLFAKFRKEQRTPEVSPYRIDAEQRLAALDDKIATKEKSRVALMKRVRVLEHKDAESQAFMHALAQF